MSDVRLTCPRLVSCIVVLLVPDGLAEYRTVNGGFWLRSWPGPVARYNDDLQVILSSYWHGRDLKYLLFSAVEVKLFWPIPAISFDLRQICVARGFVRAFSFCFR